MNLQTNYFWKLPVSFTVALGFVLLYLQATAASNSAQQINKSSNSQLNNESKQERETLKLAIKNEDQYFLGEKVVVKFVLTNQTSEKQKVKDIKWRRFNLKMEGIFANDGTVPKTVKEINFDGNVIPIEDMNLKPGDRIPWARRVERPRDFLMLAENQEMSRDFDLTKFFEHLGQGEYVLTVKSPEGYEATAKFEVVYDKEKSAAVLAELLKSKSDAEQNWGVATLRRHDIQKLIELLTQMQALNDERLRQWATMIINDISKGRL